MLLVVSALKGYAIEASDGRIGAVNDVLFDDETWKMRWLVIETGTWLNERKVLVHPSAIGQADHERQELRVTLTKAQVKGSPDIFQGQPVSRQMEAHLFDYYGWDRYWGSSYFGAGAIASPLSSPPYFGAGAINEAAGAEAGPDSGDPHLRSVAAVAAWDIRYLIVDTRNWWPGKHVLVSPYAVREISWSDRLIRLGVARDQVKASPPWDPADMIDEAYEKRLHGHYGWPGYGF